MFFELILGAGLIAAPQPQPLPEMPLPLEAVLPPDLYLVKARALKATARGLVTPTPFEIDHVYAGPGGLKGKKFTDELYEYVLNFNMPTKGGMPVAKEEPAICWIRKGKEGLEANVPVGWAWEKIVFNATLKDNPQAGKAERRTPTGDLVFRNFERSDVKYEMAVARADVCEKIYHAGDKERLKLIDDYVRSGDSVKGAAALSLLSRGSAPKPAKSPKEQPVAVKNPKIADYVLPFSNEDAVPPRMQREVEQLLLLNKEGWAGSPERWKMYQRWAGGDWKEKKGVPWDASEERAVAEALTYVNPAFSLSQTLELGIIGLANPARSDRFKAELIWATTWSLKSQDSRSVQSKGFSEVLNTIRNDRTPARKVAAAKLLVAFAPFSGEQRATLMGLRQEKLGEEVTKEIARALMQK